MTRRSVIFRRRYVPIIFIPNAENIAAHSKIPTLPGDLFNYLPRMFKTTLGGIHMQAPGKNQS